MTTETTTAQVIGLIVAGYGALLSTTLAIREYLKTRPKIKLYCEHTGKEADYLIIRVVNEGERPLSIVDVGILNEQGKAIRSSLILVQDELPRTLAYGQVYEWKAPIFAFGTDKIIAAYARNAAGKMYKVKILQELPSPKTTESQTANE